MTNKKQKTSYVVQNQVRRGVCNFGIFGFLQNKCKNFRCAAKKSYFFVFFVERSRANPESKSQNALPSVGLPWVPRGCPAQGCAGHPRSENPRPRTTWEPPEPKMYQFCTKKSTNIEKKVEPYFFHFADFSILYLFDESIFFEESIFF